MNDRYHHGDLRNALIIAAAEQIEASGTLDFAITDTAKRAGVSQGAPYRHFRDRSELLHAVRELAFLGLYYRLEAVSRCFPPGDITLIIEMGQNYIDYAREKAVFFPLMWNMRDEATEASNEQRKPTGFDFLEDAVAAYLAQHNNSREPVRVATQLWAAAHGIATLELGNMINAFDKTASARALLTQSTHAILAATGN